MKLRKIFVVVLVLLMGASTVFAQEAASAEEQKNALSLDLFTLLKGIIASDDSTKTTIFALAVGYERLVAPHFSIGAELDLYFGKVYDIDGSYFGLSAVGRYYPMSENFEKFFLGASLGINRFTIDGKADAEYGGFFGLTTNLRAGYKLILPKNVYIEPSMAYVLSKVSLMTLMGTGISVTPLGWQGGLRFGFVF
jgi:hypothetical protein